MSRDRAELEEVAAYAGFELLGPIVERELAKTLDLAAESADDVDDPLPTVFVCARCSRRYESLRLLDRHQAISACDAPAA